MSSASIPDNCATARSGALKSWAISFISMRIPSNCTSSVVPAADRSDGNSSSALKDLPIDIIKTDQRFTRCIGEEPSGEAIVVAIINISDALGLKVIAEGVEEKRHDQFMISKNCFAAQGYYYNRPTTALQFIALLNDD
ncbi:MAG: hypothetical protein ACI9LO_001980 [Planctomycetota bacterium]|jgi:hypothetical protein